MRNFSNLRISLETHPLGSRRSEFINARRYTQTANNPSCLEYTFFSRISNAYKQTSNQCNIEER